MLKFYVAPWSRASGTWWLLEELGIEYEKVHIDIRAEGGVPEKYRAVQPNKKVPAIDHDGTVVTERAAICLYLTERFPDAGLAPVVGDPDRAAFLSMLVYCDSVFDPAVAARAQNWEYKPSSFSFGSFEDMVAHLERTLEKRPYAAGDRFTAADTQLASGIMFTRDILKTLPDKPVFRTYVDRCFDRPAYRRYQEAEAKMAGVA